MLNEVQIRLDGVESSCIGKKSDRENVHILFTLSSVTLVLHLFALLVDFFVPRNKGHEAVQGKGILDLHSICILFYSIEKFAA